MYVLGIDCATAACSAAICHDEEIISRQYEEMARGQAEALVPMIERVLSAAGRKAMDLDLIASTVGPGAYTGVRIVLSTAQALSLAASVPLAGVTTFEAIARAQGPQTRGMLVALETKRADIYVQYFDANGCPVSKPAAVEEAVLPDLFSDQSLRIAGDAGERAATVLRAAGRDIELTGGPVLPDATWVARLAGERFAAGDILAAEPMYLRPPDVGPPRKRRP